MKRTSIVLLSLPILFAAIVFGANANAAVIGYNFSAGPISTSSAGGLGVNIGDSVSAMFTLDNEKTGADALINFMMDVGGQSWTEADVDSVNDISFAAGELSNLSVRFLKPDFASMTWATNNTWNVLGIPQSTGVAFCNDCVSFERKASDVPTPATLALMGLGLVGLGWSKRKKA